MAFVLLARYEDPVDAYRTSPIERADARWFARPSYRVRGSKGDWPVTR